MKTNIKNRKQLDEFVELVCKVREAQRLYYKTKSKDVLSMSISLEKKLDSLFFFFFEEEGEK